MEIAVTTWEVWFASSDDGKDAIAMQNFGRRYVMPPQYNYVKSSKHDISQSNSVVGMFLTGTFTSYDNMNDGEDSKSIAQKVDHDTTALETPSRTVDDP
ncbi:hypothetical protein E3N88_31271 [Mikania micrantha]|uniref:Uncharacterized protein n=1 Tax=Mikania micrantha TaxID=192012 RepID=A0A5N6MR90_9ASTR|nr:hypothetical protein E3N88_31271 [Mikania micrantha]